MNDVSKCSNSDCPLGKICKRRVETENSPRQVWTRFEYKTINGNHFGCDNYLKNNEKNIQDS